MAEHIRVPHLKNNFLIQAHRVLGPTPESPIGKFYAKEVPVVPPIPVLDRVELPEPNDYQAQQLVNANPGTDLAQVVQVIAEKAVENKESTVVVTAGELMEAREDITEETIHFLEKLRPNIIAVPEGENLADEHLIFQKAEVFRAAYDDFAAGDLD